MIVQNAQSSACKQHITSSPMITLFSYLGKIMPKCWQCFSAENNYKALEADLDERIAIGEAYLQDTIETLLQTYERLRENIFEDLRSYKQLVYKVAPNAKIKKEEALADIKISEILLSLTPTKVNLLSKQFTSKMDIYSNSLNANQKKIYQRRKSDQTREKKIVMKIHNKTQIKAQPRQTTNLKLSNGDLGTIKMLSTGNVQQSLSQTTTKMNNQDNYGRLTQNYEIDRQSGADQLNISNITQISTSTATTNYNQAKIIQTHFLNPRPYNNPTSNPSVNNKARNNQLPARKEEVKETSQHVSRSTLASQLSNQQYNPKSPNPSISNSSARQTISTSITSNQTSKPVQIHGNISMPAQVFTRQADNTKTLPINQNTQLIKTDTAYGHDSRNRGSGNFSRHTTTQIPPTTSSFQSKNVASNTNAVSTWQYPNNEKYATKGPDNKKK